MNEWLGKLKENFMKIWESLTKVQKISIMAFILSSLAFIILFGVASTRVHYEPLFTELEAKDAALIKDYLEKKGIKYRISGTGTIIEVDRKEKYVVRLDVSKDGLVPQNGRVGLEIFDNTKIGATEFDKKMMFLRAQKGELERTIKALKQVKNASVNITLGNNSPFLDERMESKASVLVQLNPFETLNEENVKGIMMMVASSVEGMTVEDVRVMDTEGNILSDRVEFDEDGSVINRKRRDLERAIAKDLEKNASSVLSVMGPGNTRVKVSVELDFDRESYQKEIYTTPTVAGEQLGTGLVRSTQLQQENYNGSKDVAEGVPGTTSNIPEYVGVEEGKTDSSYIKNNSIINYEMDKQNSSFEKSVGGIRRMTVSVMLNKNASYFKDIEFSDEERNKFQRMVETAVGANYSRGDKINVDVIPFDTQVNEQFDIAVKREEQRIRNLYIAGISAIAILIIIIIAYTVYRGFEARKIRAEEEKAIDDLLPQFEEFELETNMSVEDQERMDQENQIKQIAKQKPEEVANLIRNWLSED
jgi:flagellar M-ring protein FliF